MKKTVGAVIFMIIFVFSGCSGGERGYVSELTQSTWQAQLEGGGNLYLSFDGDHATLDIQSGKEQTQIKGRVIADEKSFVIFDRELAQNYGFEYVPRGEQLELCFEGNTVVMDKILFVSSAESMGCQLDN